MKYICMICGYIYDEEKGIPGKNIAPGTKWEVLPEDWICPVCKAAKSDFKLLDQEKNDVNEYKPHVDKKISNMEMSIICSNLARGCEKQYLFDQAEGFKKLSEVFFNKSFIEEKKDIERLIELTENDLEEKYPYANSIAVKHKDRGAQRVIVWGEKVTRMLNSLLKRYKKEGEKMFEDTSIWVCSVCGFIYLGENAPDICPVCKVPDWKFEKIEGRM